MSFKMEMMQQETPEEAGIICFIFLLWVSLCYYKASVLCFECPRQHHAALPLLDLNASKASSHPCQLHPSPLSLSFFPSCPHLTFSFQLNPSFAAVVTPLTLSSLKDCVLSLCLCHLSPNLCDLLWGSPCLQTV